MADQISNYRQVRLVLQVPQGDQQRTYFSVHAVGVKRGIPTASVLADGVVAPMQSHPTLEEIVEALSSAVSQLRLF